MKNFSETGFHLKSFVQFIKLFRELVCRSFRVFVIKIVLCFSEALVTGVTDVSAEHVRKDSVKETYEIICNVIISNCCGIIS